MAEQALYTCLSCAVAFSSAEEQRLHYRTDFHRYNMKRRVAALPPVPASVFNQKVLERRQETAVTTSAKGSFCEACRKYYASENAYRAHLSSKKHKEAELRTAASLTLQKKVGGSAGRQDQDTHSQTSKDEEISQVADALVEDDSAHTLEERLAAARLGLTAKHCLFCTHLSFSLEDNMKHMDVAHSFFIPDEDYIVDLPGLLFHLGEKIAVQNVCIFCNTKSRDFRSLDAVRKHMVDKSHCKVAYGTDLDKLSVSDYYDFSSSWPEAEQITKGKAVVVEVAGSDEDDWEDVDVENGTEDDSAPADSDASDDDELPDSEITYGDSPFELVLPSGARIGHRALRRYYSQNLTHKTVKKDERIDPKSGAALVKRLVSDKKSDLVPVKGGFGAFGDGTQVVKARNRGEAREAAKSTRQFREHRRREEFKTKIGFIHNSQKHFRDPLLQ